MSTTKTKTETVRARMEPNVKKRAEKVLKSLGLTSSEAINVFYHKIIAEQGIPFSLNVPNKETREAIAEVRGKEGGVSFGEWKRSHVN